MTDIARLDDTDRKLLAMLRQDSRLGVSHLAKELDIPRTQVYARLERFETDNIIAGYTVKLGESFSKTRLRAHVMVKCLPKLNPQVAADMAQISEVTAIHAISGEYDVLCMLEAADSVELNDLLDRIGALEGVERTTTSVILATRLER